jgi:hypothetical protein
VKRFAFVLLAVLVLAPGAGAKGDVQAKLATPLPLKAAAGTKLKVSWTLSTNGRPFDAQAAVFVRLRGAEQSTRSLAFQPSRGRYVAKVTVPRGGMRAIEIGIPGTMCDAAGCRPRDLIFPLRNDPFPATKPTGDGGTSFPWRPAAVGLVLLGLIATLLYLRGRRAVPVRA